MIPKYRLVSKIFEKKPYPLVVHVFYGETKAEAEAYYRAHQNTDRFLSGCKRGYFMNFRCREESYFQMWNGRVWKNL